MQVLARNDLKSIMQSKMGYSSGAPSTFRIGALFASLSQAVGMLGVEVTYDNLLRAVQYLEDAGYDMGSDVTWFFSPAQKAGIAKMDTFINASYVGEDAARMAHERRPSAPSGVPHQDQQPAHRSRRWPARQRAVPQGDVCTHHWRRSPRLFSTRLPLILPTWSCS
ncbi:hypothetical protein, partial [Candidatus Amarobacter glycogenicus]|uniref:hypothetical protein n=1 Tax=Candidatus Amarobacter glycogenicus TaxID=3140699 RepID=UPI002A0FD5C9|nr:hypothetical protein [Dehalococcoidia bacterium]